MQYSINICYKDKALPVAEHFGSVQDMQRYLTKCLADPMVLNIVVTPAESEDFKAGRVAGIKETLAKFDEEYEQQRNFPTGRNMTADWAEQVFREKYSKMRSRIIAAL